MIHRKDRLTYPDYGRDEIMKDFSGHTMTIALDSGLYRHLKFRGSSSIFWFDIVTWPGMLAINGDCGTYVFSRLEDMYEFFRDGNGKAGINPSYWAEKLQATDCHGRRGHVGYSEHKARLAIADIMRSLRGQGASNDIVREFKESVVLDESIESLVRSVQGWSYTEYPGQKTWYGTDYWEYDVEDFTRSFIWNLHAIVWGIQQYDKAKEETHE